MTPQASGKKLEPPAPVGKPPQIAGTELLVDDEEIIRQLGQKILERSGYKVITARNGREGIEIYKQNRHTIDMVILDMTMPGLDGCQTMTQMLAEFPEVKIMISTGHPLNDNLGQADQPSFCGILQKPYRAHELTSKVAEGIKSARK